MDASQDQPSAPPRPKVVTLHTGEEVLAPGQPNPDVIELLESLLDRAKTGDINEIAVAKAHADGAFSFDHAGLVSVGGIGAVAMLQNWMLHQT